MKKLILACLVAMAVVSCGKTNKGTVFYSASDFDTVVDGKKVALYTLTNANGMTAQITNYGGHVAGLWVPSKDGSLKDVVVGYPTIKAFFDPNNTYGGPIIGRYANRIAKGKYSIDGTEYSIAINNGENALHGGLVNYSQRVWDARPFKTDAGEDALELKYLSPAGEEGFPGNLSITVVYTITNNNELAIDYKAATDAPTIINLTNHSYFNLHGDRKQSSNSHLMTINADTYTVTDTGLVPTGEIVTVGGTALDFRQPQTVGSRVLSNDPIFHDRNGYDHNYVIKGGQTGAVTFAAEVYEPATGIDMKMTTTTPGVQFYSGNSRLPQDVQSPYYASFVCLEAQNYPDAPNHDDFPSALLRPGETYTQTTVYAFSVKNL